MQLFHISYNQIKIDGEKITIFSIPELITQLRKVIRIKKGDYISVQVTDKSTTYRYKICVENWTDKELEGKIEEIQNFQNGGKEISIFIAMPNKREKAELIVQKLTEIGVTNIYFWTSEHSVIRQRNEKKSERLEKISREAVEQSRGLMIPEIKFLNKDEIMKSIEGKEIYLANMNGKRFGEYKSDGLKLCGIIGPEGGFSKKDLEIFAGSRIMDLGDNILRMETASIVLARLLKNM